MRRTFCLAILVIGSVTPLGFIAAQCAVEADSQNRSRKLFSEFIAATKDQNLQRANELWSQLCVLSGFEEHKSSAGRPFDVWTHQPGRFDGGWVWVRHGGSVRAVTPEGKVLGKGGIALNEPEPQVVWNGMLPDGRPGIAFFNAKKKEQCYLMFLSAFDGPILRLMVELDNVDVTAKLVSVQPAPQIEVKTADGKHSETFPLHHGNLKIKKIKPWKVTVYQ